jgi:hypothetical protein
VDLYAGCNNIALSFPDGTACESVVDAVTPAGVVGAMWRHNAALNKWDGFSPAAPQASDLKTVNAWDAVWLCVAGAPAPAPTATVPAVAAPTATPPPPTATAAPPGPSLTPIDFNQGSADLTFTLGTATFEMAWTFQPGPGLYPFYGASISVFRAEDGGETRVCHMPAGGEPPYFVQDWPRSGSKECTGGPGRFRLEVKAKGDWTVSITPLAD